ncbi:DUF2264 domain-containing protein, partial [Streptomyces sp. YIM 130001]|uniref:DUF2264 domain-containing protein n=1 Tax=Streptomyces sp. YIM 130001 TaxID=2259644 RepID=UPI0013C4CF28
MTRGALHDLPLTTRADLQKALDVLVAPVRERLSPGGALAQLGVTGAQFPDRAAALEGFARPLWGLAPLAAGGADVDFSPYLRGLDHGTDPEHAEYWGAATDYDQRLVEMAAIALALALVPERLWDPLSPAAKERLTRWLARINETETPDNNWLFFRVLVNDALYKVGSPHYDPSAERRALQRLDGFYLGDGWYTDGPTTRRDYYVSFALHFYGLVHSRLAEDRAPELARQLRERAALFARDFAHWFADDGAALPFGRSLTYRFAQGAFWGALAYADVEALPWGQIKGLALRHLRWWARQPVTDDAGLLTVGYGYPDLNMAEEYNSPGSPYWALKFFLPLALQESHPFWRAQEEPLADPYAVSVQPQPGMLVCRERAAGHVMALTGGQNAPPMRHGAEKYAKFAYSTAFGFSVPAGGRGLEQAAADSMLALSDDDSHWRVRENCTQARTEAGHLWARWSPMSAVEVETWLLPCSPWHIRVHRLGTDRPLYSAEGGWALDRTGDDPAELRGSTDAGPGRAEASYPAGHSGLLDLSPALTREGEAVRTFPNTNVLHPRAVLPTLRARHEPGTHWLVCAVLAATNGPCWTESWRRPPTLDAIRSALPEPVRSELP